MMNVRSANRRINISKQERWEIFMAPTFDIRNIVLQNLAGSTREEVEGYIQETVDTREEEALPGMGILFEVVWSKSNRSERDNMMNKIMEGIPASRT